MATELQSDPALHQVQDVQQAQALAIQRLEQENQELKAMIQKLLQGLNTSTAPPLVVPINPILVGNPHGIGTSGDAMTFRAPILDTGVLPGQAQESTSRPLPQVSPDEATASQKAFIKQIVEAKFAEHGEESDTFDLYKVSYPVHHQFKKLPVGYTKVSKFQKFDGHGSPHEHLAYYITTMGELGTEDSYLLRYFATSLTGMAFQ